jgi:hypothetical protein
MRLRVAIAALLVLTACGGTVSKTSSPAVRAYSGTASVGDFLSISLNPTAQTLSYTNYSNSDTGTVPYTVNADGTYTLNDSKGNLISAYEVPNYALLIEADKAGPNHDTMALITSVEASPITLSSLEGKRYNYMQFRTTSGGINAGSVAIDVQGNVTTSSYWPYGALGMARSLQLKFVLVLADSGRPFRQLHDPDRERQHRLHIWDAERRLCRGQPEWRDPRLSKGFRQNLQPVVCRNLPGYLL